MQYMLVSILNIKLLAVMQPIIIHTAIFFDFVLLVDLSSAENDRLLTSVLLNGGLYKHCCVSSLIDRFGLVYVIYVY